MKKPLVSVIIPTYNRPLQLERTLESVLHQTYPEIEILVVDDASDADYSSVQQKYPEVIFLSNSQNRGQSYSRNTGFRKSKGEFINFLDDDDLLDPSKIEKQLNRFQSADDPSLGMVSCHTIDHRHGKGKTRANRVKGNCYRELLSSYLVHGVETTLYRRQALLETGGFDEKLQAHEEHDLLIRCARHFTFDFIDEVLSEENKSPGQDSLNFSKRITATVYLYQKHQQRFFEEGFLFGMRLSFKYLLLIGRYWVGRLLGEKVYLLLIR